MAGNFLWDNLNLSGIALVQGACSVFAFSWYHRMVLQVFAVAAPFYISTGTSVAPDKLDLVFMIAINAVIWWPEFFGSLVEEVNEAFSDGVWNVLVLGFQFMFYAIVGYICAAGLSAIMFTFTTIIMLFSNTPPVASRVSVMLGTWNAVRTGFQEFDKNEYTRGGIRRFGIVFGASLFFVREHGFFSSNIFYTWERMGEVLRGEVTDYDRKFFSPKKTI